LNKQDLLISSHFLIAMTLVLTDMIRSNFVISNPNNISIYDKNKRIEINLSDEYDLRNIDTAKKIEPFNNHERIKHIAEQIFDVDFLYETQGNTGPAVFFMPSLRDKYNQNHVGHYIQVHLPNSYPVITIGTGEKGASTLLEKQRENYLQFVREVYNIFWARSLVKKIKS
jgi:hypothetical protein